MEITPTWDEVESLLSEKNKAIDQNFLQVATLKRFLATTQAELEESRAEANALREQLAARQGDDKEGSTSEGQLAEGKKPRSLRAVHSDI